MTRNENKHSTEEETQLKLSERLLEARTLVICGEIHQKLAKEVCEKLIVLSNESDKQIWIYLNSQGGHVEAGDTIFDMIQFVKARVRIIGTGWVASAGALIYSAPPKEDRFALPNTRFMLHQPFGGAGGQASDVKIEAEELLKMRERLNAIFAKQTGQPIVKINKDSDRNFWMSSSEAVEYGLVGKVVGSVDEIE
ncbi:MAG TPA: ATP-dependent Clp protease proteolytic subunit [Verrucomicrobiales bacterium]|nr:ATP-dependent Clp protease proteolytic subunit [Verrucomicrobiales bacterium]